MSNVSGTAGLPEITESYEAIERLVMETPRGRWFLDEFARRQRAKELSMVLDSVQRLERAIAVKEAAAETDSLANRITKAIDTPVAARAAEENLEARQLRYFRKDEDIFQPAPPTAPRAVVTEPELEKRGARLVIRRNDEATTAADPFAPGLSPKEPEAAKPTETLLDEPPKRRIVIIRHKAGEEMNVPLQNEIAEAS